MSKNSDERLPRIARYKPYYVEPIPGRTYFWCACGLSDKQPFCDGSHKGTGIEPVKFVAPGKPSEVLFCGCKHTSDGVHCDGTHNNLRDAYETDDPDSEDNQTIPLVAVGNDGRAMLDGGCFVASVDKLRRHAEDDFSWAPVIGADTGAIHQSQFFFELENGDSPPIDFGDRHVLLFVGAGRGSVNIAGRQFSLEPCTGAYVRPGESFALSKSGNTALRVFASVCPLDDEPGFPPSVRTKFDERLAERIVALEDDNRTEMADRFFQILIGKEQGCTVATQFIGEIPYSKAAVHRHLYEESLIVVSGHGCMWTETGKAPVRSGDVIFLPRKQAHSLQCTSSDGMLVAGVIYPGDNPGINY